MRDILTSPTFLVVWALVVVGVLAVLARDLRVRNPQTGSMMKWVWWFTVLYSGPLGLAIYCFSGRRQITRDSWASLIVSLSAGLVVAYPANVALIRFGVKEGMGSPKEPAPG